MRGESVEREREGGEERKRKEEGRGGEEREMRTREEE